jgi:NB-ARC domain
VPDLLSNSFAGREAILHSVACSLTSTPQERISRVALWGIPGVGKTQVALSFTNRHQDQYTHVLFVNAISPATIVGAYRTFARRLKLLRQDQDLTEEYMLVDLVKTWLSDHTGWLIVFDNALEPGLVRRYTPVEGTGHIFFTTRSQIAAEALAERASVIELPVLSSHEAIELALKLQNIDSTHFMERKAAGRLAELTGGLPIAIEQTVSLACLRKVSLSAVLPSLEKKRILLRQSHPLSMHEDRCSTGAILALTLDTLKVQSPQAVELFLLLVYFDPSSIPKNIITIASMELRNHFARLETYDRGLEVTAEELFQTRFKALRARGPWYYREVPDLEFWVSRMPFRRRLPANTLPRIDSRADQHLERHLCGDGHLKEVLEKPVRIENAFLDLRQAGLIRNLDVNTVWIHDLFAQLAIALVEEKAQATHQVTAHTVLLMIYLAFPLPSGDRVQRHRCFNYLPHAISVLQHCRPFYNDLTVGPELAHLTASTFSLRIFEFSSMKDQNAVENATFYYKLAFTGYYHAWKRLRDHPLVTEKEIMLCARSEYSKMDPKYVKGYFGQHHYMHQRIGSAAVRAMTTSLRLGVRIYGATGQYEEALRWSEKTALGYASLYGTHHPETQNARAVLLWLYKRSSMWMEGYSLGRTMMNTMFSGTENVYTENIAVDIADCARNLGYRDMVEEAGKWYEVALRILIHNHGESDRTQLIILIRLALLEDSEHNHHKALWYAQKGLQIFQDTSRAEPVWNQPSKDRLVELEHLMAAQNFALGDTAAAKAGCERALQICTWDARTDHTDYTGCGSLWDSGLRVVRILGYIEFAGATVPEDWEIPSHGVTKVIASQAFKEKERRKDPCCPGLWDGIERLNPDYLPPE